MSIQAQKIRVFAKGNSINIADNLFSIDGELEAIPGNGPSTVIVRTVGGRQRVLCIPYYDIYKEDNINTWASTRASTVTLLNALFNHTNPSDYADKSDTTASISSINSEITNIKNTLKVDGDRGIYKDPDNSAQANVRLVTNSSLVVAASDKTRIDIGEASPGVIDLIVNSNTNVGPDTAITALTISGDAASAKASVTLSANATLAGFNLTKLSDVSINSPSTGQVIKYDGAQWVNGASTSGTTLPTGGVEDTFLQKNSGTNYDLKWSAYRMPPTDGAEGTVLTTNGAGSVSFAYPQTLSENVKNVSGGTLYKGTPVHVTGSVGSLAEVVAADAATNYPAHFVLNEDLADDGEGLGIAIGFINNVDVPDASIYSEGQTVYLGASGGWVTTKPTGTNAIQNLGIIIKVNVSGNKISGIIMGAGRANDVPNIPEGQAWIGNASGVATPTTLASIATSGNIVDDTTPQLGGDLDVNGKKFVSTSNGNIVFDPDGTGSIIFKSDDIQFDGAGTFSGSVTLYESDILGSNYVKLSAPLSVSSNTSLFLPDGVGSSGQVITSDGIGNMTWQDNNIVKTTTASEQYYGDIVSFGTGPGGVTSAIEAGKIYYLDSTQQWEEADASAVATGGGMLALATQNGSNRMMVRGIARHVSWAGLGHGSQLFLSETSGELTTTAPSTAGTVVRVVGFCTNTTTREIYFNPSMDNIEN